MRCLYLVHEESDYGGGFLYNGLCRVLGHENVYDYPNKVSYHGRAHTYNRPWHNNEEGNTGQFPWMGEGYPEKPLDLEAVRGLLRDGYFDLVILESWRWTVQKTYGELCEDIRIGGAKVILHDGEDYSQFNREALETVRPDFYLKRELLKNYDFSNQSGPVVLPFPFSAPDQIVEWADRQPPAAIQRDIACLLGLSWQPRQDLADELRKGMDEPYCPYRRYVATNADSDRNNPQHLLGFWEYLELLRTSRFGVSMRGFGWDTCRYWEIAVLTGLIADELDIQIPNPFTPGENICEYENPPQARMFAQSIGLCPADYEPIREAGIAHARKYHLNSSRVKWLLERVAD